MAAGLLVPSSYAVVMLENCLANHLELKSVSTMRPLRSAILWTGLLALLPWQACYDYIDPSAAGPVYQVLLPLLVAIASGLAAFRRSLKRLWRRMLSAVGGFARGADAATPRDPPA